MRQVDRLFTDYVEEHRSGGEADPLAYLKRTSGPERRELAALIEGYLERAERVPFDEQAFRGSAAERTVDELERSLAGRSGLWPAVLPRLRSRIGLKRSELVARLADGLGVGDRREKVGAYYHEMEQGSLDAAGISDRVLDVLGAILGETRESLRELGSAIGGGGAQSTSAAVFTRVHRTTEGPTEDTGQLEIAEDEWDEVDRLFRGS